MARRGKGIGRAIIVAMAMLLFLPCLSRGLWPQYMDVYPPPQNPMVGHLIGIVIWLAAIGAGLATWLRVQRKLKKMKQATHCCPNCGYDLRVNPGGGCPECGWQRGAGSNSSS